MIFVFPFPWLLLCVQATLKGEQSGDDQKTLELLPASSSLSREVHSVPRRQHDTCPSNTGADGGETHRTDRVSVCLQGFCFLLVR